MLSQITRLAATSPKLRREGSCLCRKLRLELLSLRLHLVFPLSHRIARGDEHHFCMVRFARIQRAAKMQRHVAEAIAWQQAPGLRTCRRHSLFLQILSALSQGMPSRLLVASWWQLAAFDAFFYLVACHWCRCEANAKRQLVQSRVATWSQMFRNSAIKMLDRSPSNHNYTKAAPTYE